MRCFRCAKEIVIPPKDDPIYNTIPDPPGFCYFMPGIVLEVLQDCAIPDDTCHCAVVCWACFAEIHPDMWIEKRHWTALAPAIPFEKLPVFDHENEQAEEIEIYTSYAPV